MDSFKSLISFFALVFLVMVNPSRAIPSLVYGTVSWEQIPSSTGTTIQFTIDAALRYSEMAKVPPIGGTYSTNDNVFSPDNSITMFKGSFTVRNINTGQDWILLSQIITFNYAAPGNYVAFFSQCCRPRWLLNNPNSHFRIASAVKVERFRNRKSPKISSSPILYTNTFTNFQFSLRFTSSPLVFRRWRLPKVDEFEASGTNNPYSNYPFFFYNQAGDCRLFSLSATYYTFQVILEEHSEAVAPEDFSKLISSVSVDFTVNAQSFVKKCQSHCNEAGTFCEGDSSCTGCEGPGTCAINSVPRFTSIDINGDLITSLNGPIVLKVSIGMPSKLVVSASDPDTYDTVTISHTALPEDAVVVLDDSKLQESKLTIEWTPKANFNNTIACFSLTDSIGDSNTGSLCVSFELTDFVLRVSGDGAISSTAGVPTQFSLFSIEGRTHKAVISSGSFSYECVVDPISPGSSEYLVKYTVEKTGFFSLAISDTTSGSPYPSISPLLLGLNIRNDISDPGSAVITNGAGAGLSGGPEDTDATFEIRTRDRLGNPVDCPDDCESKSDKWRIRIIYEGDIVSNTLAIPDETRSELVFLASYKVPKKNQATTYKVEVLFRRVGEDFELINSYDADLITNLISIEVESRFEVIAGNSISLTWNVPDAVSNFAFSVTYEGIGYDYTNTGNKFTLQGPKVTKAGEYPDAITIYEPQMAFPVKVTLIVTPSSVSSLTVSSNDPLTAGLRERFLLSFEDEFGNRLTGKELPNVELTTCYDCNVDSETETIEYSASGFLTSLTKIFKGVLFYKVEIQGGPSFSGSRYVQAGPISSASSSLDLDSFITAGNNGMASLTLKDENGNIDADQSNVNSSFWLDDGFSVSGSGGVSEIIKIGDSFRMKFQSTLTGKHFLDISLNDEPFMLKSVYVQAGELDLASTEWKGNGTVDALEKSLVSVLIQGKDRFKNVNSSLGGAFFLKVTHEIHPTFYLRAEYCAPRTTECKISAKHSDSDLFTFSDNSKDPEYSSAYAVEEELLLPDGFYRAMFLVPDHITNADQYTVGIYFVPSSLVIPENTTYTTVFGNEDFLLNFFTAKSIKIASSTSALAEVRSWFVTAIAIAAGIFFLAAVFYGAWRLQRYRPKYLIERKEAEDAEMALKDMVDEMDIISGQQDYEALGAATVSANPLHPAYQIRSQAAAAPQPVDTGKMEDTLVRGAFRKEFKPAPAKNQTREFL